MNNTPTQIIAKNVGLRAALKSALYCLYSGKVPADLGSFANIEAPNWRKPNEIVSKAPRRLTSAIIPRKIKIIPANVVALQAATMLRSFRKNTKQKIPIPIIKEIIEVIKNGLIFIHLSFMVNILHNYFINLRINFNFLSEYGCLRIDKLPCVRPNKTVDG